MHCSAVNHFVLLFRLAWRGMDVSPEVLGGLVTEKFIARVLMYQSRGLPLNNGCSQEPTTTREVHKT
eukprot:530743-Amphidinium_carterae.1